MFVCDIVVVFIIVAGDIIIIDVVISVVVSSPSLFVQLSSLCQNYYNYLFTVPVSII